MNVSVISPNKNKKRSEERVINSNLNNSTFDAMAVPSKAGLKIQRSKVPMINLAGLYTIQKALA